MRLLILLVIIYITYRAVKSWMFQNSADRQTVIRKTSGEIDGLMIKDPLCETYFSKEDGVHLRVGEKDLYFCSEDCKNRYVAIHSSKASDF